MYTAGRITRKALKFLGALLAFAIVFGCAAIWLLQTTVWHDVSGAANQVRTQAAEVDTEVEDFRLREEVARQTGANPAEIHLGEAVTVPSAPTAVPTVEVVEVIEEVEVDYLDDEVAIMATSVFTYTPGGEGFGMWATDVEHPEGYEEDDCGRVWQATNLENLPWTAVFCNWTVSDPEPKLQWPHPTQLTVSGAGIVEFELHRDHAASAEVRPDPYQVANVKNSPLGLGWFVQGFNGTVCVDGDCVRLEGGGVYQIGFPQDMDGFYTIRLVVDNGQVQFWQGERLTTVNNWPLPESVR